MHKLREFEGYQEKHFEIETKFSKHDNNFVIEYRLSGSIDDLVINEKAEHPCFRDELWKHTCFEAFIQDPKSSAYWEFNFSPSRDWAIYRFASYRSRIVTEGELPFELLIQQERYPRQLIMKVKIKGTPGVKLDGGRAGLSAVLEHKDDSRSYWALTHLGDKPDFHTIKSFIINL
ncbi:MAG: DOMON-like domain-containing protein [Chitinophagaceae bacterium]|nr:DOMON-like domain-containing protein [Oligoflexus sp.]